MLRMDPNTNLGGGALPGHHARANANQTPVQRFKNQKPLNTLDVACLIINKMIGGGILVSSSNVTFLTGNKLVALCLWIFGGLYSFCR